MSETVNARHVARTPEELEALIHEIGTEKVSYEYDELEELPLCVMDGKGGVWKISGEDDPEPVLIEPYNYGAFRDHVDFMHNDIEHTSQLPMPVIVLSAGHEPYINLREAWA